MDTNDDRAVDVNEFITFFGRRHRDGGWLKTDVDAQSEVLALADGTVGSPKAKKKGGKRTKGKKVKGKKKR